MSSQRSEPSTQPAAATSAGSIVREESLLVLGNDAALAARPATPVQLAQAALRAGFDAVLPASWGDELIAAECARRLCAQGATPAIFCACPEVAHRALNVGSELAPFLVSLVAPPVALARYLRALYAPRAIRLTYVGRCPGAQSDAYDARVTPEELLRLLADRHLAPGDQPDAFEDVVPPDRRRFHSLAGGLPAAGALQATGSPHGVVELGGDDFAAELAQHLLGRQPKLIDASVRLGCACAGARSGCIRHPRIELAAVEPPRASGPVLDLPQWMRLDLDMPLPFASRSASDLVATIGRRRDEHSDASAPGGVCAEDRAVPHVTEGIADAVQPPRRRSPAFGIPAVRTPSGAGPTTRAVDGRVLPRAYVARRRPGPRPTIDEPQQDPPRR